MAPLKVRQVDESIFHSIASTLSGTLKFRKPDTDSVIRKGIKSSSLALESSDSYLSSNGVFLTMKPDTGSLKKDFSPTSYTKTGLSFEGTADDLAAALDKWTKSSKPGRKYRLFMPPNQRLMWKGSGILWGCDFILLMHNPVSPGELGIEIRAGVIANYFPSHLTRVTLALNSGLLGFFPRRSGLIDLRDLLRHLGGTALEMTHHNDKTRVLFFKVLIAVLLSYVTAVSGTLMFAVGFFLLLLGLPDAGVILVPGVLVLLLMIIWIVKKSRLPENL